MSKFLKKLGRRLIEPSTIAGAGGAPVAAVVLSSLFPAHAMAINLGAAVVGGALIARKEKKTIKAEIAAGEHD
ncbi:MAG: hypothetical protein IOC66_33940 [Burkholderia sp.]|nr:hypothetical protein [Alphaproteobacteria bacterium]MCA3797276.1 hypothetical protein [Burkholderia sp.]